jgi:hypothetical protein
MTHLTEQTINEYLDNALAPSTRADVDAHLAVCDDCRSELDAMRSLFAEIESLPVVALERDLAPAVVAQIGVKVSMPRPLGWALAVQGMVAVIILAALWPVLDLSTLQLPIVSLTWPSLPTLPDFSRIFATVPSFSLQLDPPALLLTLTIVSACLLWLVGNGLLLVLPHSASLKRRNS